jgi:hypothetical protein
MATSWSTMLKINNSIYFPNDQFDSSKKNWGFSFQIIEITTYKYMIIPKVSQVDRQVDKQLKI